MTTSSSDALVVHNLSKIVTTTDSSLTLLQQINLQVLQGDSLAIVGSSGSGKSTLLGLLAGLDVATDRLYLFIWP
jgi:putative ABC transport system ATP-binding protein